MSDPQNTVELFQIGKQNLILTHMFLEQQPANHYFEQPRYYSFLAGHPEPSAPLADDLDQNRASHRSEREIFRQFLDHYDFDHDVIPSPKDAVDIDLVDSDSDAVDIDLVDSENERINLRKRVPPPPPQQAIPKRRLVRRKPIHYEESSSSSCRLGSSSFSESVSSDSYEVDSFVEQDDALLCGQSSYSDDGEEDEEDEEEDEEEEE